MIRARWQGLNKITAVKFPGGKKALKITVASMLAAVFLWVAVAAAGEIRKKSLSVSISGNGAITVTLPDGFITEKDNDAIGGENLSVYNIKGSLKTASLKGFAVGGYFREAVLKESLADYLTKSEEYKSAAIYDLQKETVQVNNAAGYIWRYKIKQEDGSHTTVRSAFFAGVNKFYTILLSVNNSDKEKEAALEAAFNKTINSIQFTDGSVQSGKLSEWYNFRNQASLHHTQLFRAKQAGDRIGRFSQGATAHEDPSQF